eukprot:scaffold16898_cov45-Isochrysis_galbana.AAC.1
MRATASPFPKIDQSRAARLHGCFHAGDGLVEQVHQARHVAGPRLELFAVRAAHQPKRAVVQPLVAHEAGPTGGGEDQLEVLGLAGVGHIDEP